MFDWTESGWLAVRKEVLVVIWYVSVMCCCSCASFLVYVGNVLRTRSMELVLHHLSFCWVWKALFGALVHLNEESLYLSINMSVLYKSSSHVFSTVSIFTASNRFSHPSPS
jgi:hypothetical protein